MTSQGAPTPSSSPPSHYNVVFIWKTSLIAALGGLLFGYDWVVVGGAKPFFERYFDLTDPASRGWANSCALIGCLVGALIAGVLSDRLGRKRLLLFSASLFAVTSIGNGLAGTFTVFVLWRMLGGVAIGLASSLSPVYIAEIAPAHLRGRLVSTNQLTIVIGILLAQLVNWWLVRDLPREATESFIASSWYGQKSWRWMFVLTSVPSLFFFLGMFLVPESPRWLAKKGRTELARHVLSRVGGEGYAGTALSEINATLDDEATKVRFRELLDPRLRRVMVLGITLAVFQQWCGINVIFNYAEDVFAAAGYRVSDIMLNIVITGAVNLGSTMVAIATVDRVGRRPLLLVGAAGLAIIYTALGACYAVESQGMHMLLLVVAAIACYGMSLAPITWVVISEIFPNRVRGAAMSVAVMSLWSACFVLTYSFPWLNRQVGPAGTFWTYAVICVAGLVYIARRLPETRGKTLETIEKELVR